MFTDTLVSLFLKFTTSVESLCDCLFANSLRKSKEVSFPFVISSHLEHQIYHLYHITRKRMNTSGLICVYILRAFVVWNADRKRRKRQSDNIDIEFCSSQDRIVRKDTIEIRDLKLSGNRYKHTDFEFWADASVIKLAFENFFEEYTLLWVWLFLPNQADTSSVPFYSNVRVLLLPANLIVMYKF